MWGKSQCTFIPHHTSNWEVLDGCFVLGKLDETTVRSLVVVEASIDCFTVSAFAVLTVVGLSVAETLKFSRAWLGVTADDIESTEPPLSYKLPHQPFVQISSRHDTDCLNTP